MGDDCQAGAWARLEWDGVVSHATWRNTAAKLVRVSCIGRDDVRADRSAKEETVLCVAA